MPELHSIDFEMIRRFSEDLSREVLSWSKAPWSWDDMVAQYQRLHTTQKPSAKPRGILNAKI